MPDILRVTQPLTGNENNIGKMRPQLQPQQPSILDIPDPSRVTKTNNQTVYSERQNEANQPNLSANFDQFLHLLKNTPSLSDSLTQMLFSKMGTLVNSGIDANFANEISQFMDMLKMTDTELLTFLKTQSQTSVKFSGPVFDILRDALGSRPSSELKNAVLEFIRTFDNASSNGHLINNIISNLKNIAERMPSNQRDQLSKMTAKLLQVAQHGTNISNLNILKTEIFPFLSSYISMTKDFGSIRDIISSLTLNLVKYENGTTDNLMASFKKLFNFSAISEKLSKVPAHEIELMLLNSKYTQSDNSLIDAFVSIVSKGLKGGTDASAKEVFDNVLKSILINKSVYMPVQHIIIPANINGQIMFSEIWVDPDADGDGENPSSSPASKFLIKFDIDKVGFFELVMLYREGNMDMLLFYPPSFEDKAPNIKQALGQIMANNGIRCENIGVEKSLLPLAISDVFPKIFEKRDTINVKV